MEWKNVYSKMPLRMEIQTDLDAIRRHFAQTKQPLTVGKTTICFSDRPNTNVLGKVMNENEFFVTQRALDGTDELLMKTLIEENLHIYRIRNGLAQTSSATVGQGPTIDAEEHIVAKATDWIYDIGRNHQWW